MAIAAAATAAVLYAAGASAQMPGVPVLQNAFMNPGVTVGAFFGGGSGQTAGGAAAALANPAQWVQVTAGAGYTDASSTSVSYGGRLAVTLGRFVPFLRRDPFGAAVFAGAGGGSGHGVTLVTAPAGVAFGYRRGIGATRALNVYAAPFFSWNRASAEGTETKSRALFRFSVGADFALTRRLGATVGWEGGKSATDVEPGPQGSLFAGGVSYAFR
jgi:hypothetical protein